MKPYLDTSFYFNSLYRQLHILLNKTNHSEEIIQDHLRLAVIDICIIFGLDGNGKFKDTDVQKFYEKYKVQLDEIRVVRNDLIAHSFNSETTDTRKIDNHVRCYDILTKYQTPKKNTFTGDLIMLCKNKLEAYEP